MNGLMKRLWADESAANAVEYGLVAAVIALGLVVAFTSFRDQVTRFFGNVGTRVEQAGN